MKLFSLSLSSTMVMVMLTVSSLMGVKAQSPELTPNRIPLPSFTNKAPANLQKISAEELRTREGQDFPIDTIQFVSSDAINMVLMGDGFTSSQYDSFKEYAQICVDHMFNTVPFNSYKEWFNIFFIKVDSKESGISHPGYPSGTCPEGASLAITNVDTYFGVHFDDGGIHRLMGIKYSNKPYELLNAFIPDYDIAGVIGNSKEYGGSGGNVLVSSANVESNEIFIHELAHSFAALADEYYAGDSFLHECANTSTSNTETTVPWKAWWGEQGVKAYKIGGSTKGNSFYKPVNGSCRMEYLNQNFCAVCREQLVKTIHKKMKMIAAIEPNAKNIEVNAVDETAVFKVIPFDVPEYTRYEWKLDGKVIEDATTGEYELDVTGFEANSEHSIKVTVTDATPYMKSASSITNVWKVKMNEAVGLSAIKLDSNGVSISPIDGAIQITTPDYRQIIIYTADGRRFRSRHISGTETVALPRGLYIVEGQKILVK